MNRLDGRFLIIEGTCLGGSQVYAYECIVLIISFSSAAMCIVVPHFSLINEDKRDGETVIRSLA